MQREQPILSNQQRIRLAEACLTNARDLLQASEALTTPRSLPYRQFLVGAALEEVLKATYCIDEGAASWPKWWKGFTDHKAKMRLLRRHVEDLPEDAGASLLRLRERCIYVEPNAEGDPLTPYGLVEPGHLDEAYVGSLSDGVRGFARATLERLVQSGQITLPAIGEQPTG